MNDKATIYVAIMRAADELEASPDAATSTALSAVIAGLQVMDDLGDRIDELERAFDNLRACHECADGRHDR